MQNNQKSLEECIQRRIKLLNNERKNIKMFVKHNSEEKEHFYLSFFSNKNIEYFNNINPLVEKAKQPYTIFLKAENNTFYLYDYEKNITNKTHIYDYIKYILINSPFYNVKKKRSNRSIFQKMKYM